ncbi:MAG: hypothetical protein ABIQ57_18115 [Candidatus Kapaibacterium sp.]
MMRRFIPVFFLAALLAMPVFSSRAVACTSLTITNNTSCTVNITFYSGSATFTIGGIPPGVTVHPFPANFTPVGIVTLLGNHNSTPCATCVQLQISGTTLPCCAFVCASPGCNITINPATPCPGTCN